MIEMCHHAPYFTAPRCPILLGCCALIRIPLLILMFMFTPVLCCISVTTVEAVFSSLARCWIRLFHIMTRSCIHGDQTWQVSLLQTWRWWTKWYCTPCYKGGKWWTHLTTPYTHTHMKILGICHDTPYFIAHACVYSYACAILHYMCILSHTSRSGILIWCKMVDEAFPDDSTLVD